MARRYSRDNKGRFAPSGQGATARGGRLRTASGKKRETVKASPGAADKLSSTPKGTIGKTRKEREVQRLDRPGEKRPAFNKAYKSQQAANRGSKNQAASKPPAGSFAANKIEMAKGRAKDFAQREKNIDAEIQKTRNQIKEARSSAMTFGAVPGLRLKLLELQSTSKQMKSDIDKAKKEAKGQ